MTNLNLNKYQRLELKLFATLRRINKGKAKPTAIASIAAATTALGIAAASAAPAGLGEKLTDIAMQKQLALLSFLEQTATAGSEQASLALFNTWLALHNRLGEMYAQGTDKEPDPGRIANILGL